MQAFLSVRTLGGTASNVSVGAVGVGLSTLSKRHGDQILSDESAFAFLRTAIEKGGTYWNTATFYGSHDDPWANIQLIGRVFGKYPEYLHRVTIGIKGGFNPSGNFANPDSSEENLRRELNELRKILGQKTVDVFGPARRDTKLSMERVTATLAKLSKEGLFSHIGLSELSAESIRAAASVHPIASVEVESSPFTMDMEYNGVLQACEDHNIAIIAYSPLSRGFFTGTLRSHKDLPENDIRRKFDRFNEENFNYNLQLTDKVTELAKSINILPTQLTLAWELHRCDKLIPVPGTTKESNLLQNLESAHIAVPPQILKRYDGIADDVSKRVSGTRFNAMMNRMLNG